MEMENSRLEVKPNELKKIRLRCPLLWKIFGVFIDFKIAIYYPLLRLDSVALTCLDFNNFIYKATSVMKVN